MAGGEDTRRMSMATLRSRALDHLNLSENAVVHDMLESQNSDGTQREIVLFSDRLTKINRRDKQQIRVLLVTDRALYNLLPGSYTCKRRIDLRRVEKVTMSNVSDEFVVHVPSEYDYRFSGPRKDEVVEAVASARAVLVGKEAELVRSSKMLLRDVVLTRPEAERRRREDGSWAGGDPPGANREEELAEEEHDEEDKESGPEGGVTGWARKDTKVTKEDFHLLKVIGRGSFGKVMQVKHKRTGEVLAMKILNKRDLMARNQVEHTQAERAILESIDHPFLVKLRYAFQTKSKLYLILNFCRGGELFSLLRKKKRFPEDQARFYIAEVALAIGHLHSLGIVYRDLKPENILMSGEPHDAGHLLLTDFGLAKTLAKPGDTTGTFCGTPEYLAPETVAGHGSGKAVDWWALGILLYEISCGLPPFYDRNVQVMYDKIERGSLRFPSRMSPVLRDLISRLLSRDPSTRLGAGPTDVEEIKAHPFFEGLDFDALYRKEIEPPYKPEVRGELDVGNFDKEFTSEPPRETPVAESLMGQSVSGGKFEGFTFAGDSAINAEPSGATLGAASGGGVEDAVLEASDEEREDEDEEEDGDNEDEEQQSKKEEPKETQENEEPKEEEQEEAPKEEEN